MVTKESKYYSAAVEGVWRQEVLVLGTRAVVLRLRPVHPVPAGWRGAHQRTSHDGYLCAGASQVLIRFGKRGNRSNTLRRYLRGVEGHSGKDVNGISEQFGCNKTFDPY